MNGSIAAPTIELWGGVTGAVTRFRTSTTAGQPRTGGVVVVVNDLANACPIADELGPASIDPSAAVSGKVAIVARRDALVTVHQYNAATGNTVVAWCGNAVMAAMVATGIYEATVIGTGAAPGGVRAQLVDVRDGWRLRWIVTGKPVPPLRLDVGSISVWLLQNFNFYALTTGVADADLPRLGGNGKVMSLNIDSTSRLPLARIRVASGWHGAIPFTGGAALALARPELPWLASALSDGLVQTVMGDVEMLPEYEAWSEGYSLLFPARRVAIEEMALHVSV